MLQIINTPTGNVIAEFSQRKDAEAYLATIETTPATHQLTGNEETQVTENEQPRR